MKIYPNDNHIIDNVSGTHQNLIHPLANGSQVEGSFGTILTQSIYGKEYEIWQHHLFIRKPTHLFLKHTRPVLQLLFTLKGSLCFRFSDDSYTKEGHYKLAYLPNSPQEIWLEPGCYHYLQIVLDTGYVLKHGAGSPDLHQLIERADMRHPNPMALHSGYIDPYIQALILEVLRRQDMETCQEVRAQAALKELVLYYLLQSPGIAPKQSLHRADREKMEQIRNYVEKNLEERLSYRFVADRFEISVPTLKRMFKRFSGQTLNKYMHNKRMDTALYLLREKRGYVKEVAYMLGYTEPSVFSHAFIKHYGKPPSHYLKEEMTS